MHAYDADAVPGGRIVVRRARDGERLETIDHVERRLDERNAGHRRRGACHRPGRHHGRRLDRGRRRTRPASSSSRRSSTGRPSATPLGGSACARRPACGTRRGSGTTCPASRRPCREADRRDHRRAAWRAGSSTTIPSRRRRRRVPVSVDRIARLLGHRADRRTRGRAAAARSDSRWTVMAMPLEVGVPPHRLDVISDADVAEEVARAHGYERIPGRLPRAVAAAVSARSERAAPPGAPHPGRARAGRDGQPRAHRSGRPRADPVPLGRRGAGPALQPAQRGARHPAADPVPVAPRPAWPRTRGGGSATCGSSTLGKVYWYHPGTPTPRERRAETAGHRPL